MEIQNRGKNKPKYAILISIFSGICLGIFLYSYWLNSIFPALSKRNLVLTALISVSGAIIFYLLFKRISSHSITRKIGLLICAVAASFIILYFGLEGRILGTNFPVFLLPEHTLQITQPGSSGDASAEASILWINTAVGEVSFNELDYSGWQRVDDVLVLENGADNIIKWRGRIGDEAQLVFATSPASSEILINWDGDEERVDLFSQENGELTYTRQESVPFYCSKQMVVLSGLLSLSALIYLCGLSLLSIDQDFYKEFIAQTRGELDRAAWQKTDTIAIASLIVFALLFRVLNLENLPPFVDEYAHLLAAKNILAGIPIDQVYQRSLYVVTLPIVASFKLFGTHLWSARLVGVVVNSLAIFPLYLVARKINRKVAIISGVIFATNPWIISVARNIREYGYYPLYFYFIFLVMLLLLERIPKNFQFFRDWRKLIHPGTILLLFLFLTPIIYAKYVDTKSTLKTIMSVYLTFSIFFLARMNWKDRSNLLFVGLLLVVFFAGLKAFSVGVSVSDFFVTNENTFEEYFFFNSPLELQWFYPGARILIGLVLGASVVYALLTRKETDVPLIAIVQFFISALFFVSIFERYIRPRYFFNLEIWFIIPVAIGICTLFDFIRYLCRFALKKCSGNHSVVEGISLLIALLVFVPNVDFRQILLPETYQGDGFMPITTEYYYNMDELQRYVSAHSSPDDVLISTVYGNYVRWVDEPSFSELYYFNYVKDDEEFIQSIIAEHDSGWIVLDKWRGQIYAAPLPFRTFFVGDKKVTYVGLFLDEHVWEW